MKYAKKYAKSFSRGKETNFDTVLSLECYLCRLWGKGLIQVFFAIKITASLNSYFPPKSTYAGEELSSSCQKAYLDQ